MRQIENVDIRRGSTIPEEDRAATLLVDIAVALMSTKGGDRFPSSGVAEEEFVAAGQRVCRNLSSVRAAGRWPTKGRGQVGVYIAEDGSAMLLATDVPALETGEDLAGHRELDWKPVFLAVRKDGRSEMGRSGLTAELLKLAPARAGG